MGNKKPPISGRTAVAIHGSGSDELDEAGAVKNRADHAEVQSGTSGDADGESRNHDLSPENPVPHERVNHKRTLPMSGNPVQAELAHHGEIKTHRRRATVGRVATIPKTRRNASRED